MKGIYSDRLSCISALKDNWDGYGTCQPYKIVLNNTIKFVEKVEEEGLSKFLDEDNITPTPYGTIDVDLVSDNGVISVEIGKGSIGYFVDFKDNKQNIDSDILPLSDDDILEVAKLLLKGKYLLATDFIAGVKSVIDIAKSL